MPATKNRGIRYYFLAKIYLEFRDSQILFFVSHLFFVLLYLRIDLEFAYLGCSFQFHQNRRKRIFFAFFFVWLYLRTLFDIAYSGCSFPFSQNRRKCHFYFLRRFFRFVIPTNIF